MRTHGTYSCYNAGCHCEQCRAANAACKRRFREEHPETVHAADKRRFEKKKNDPAAIEYHRSYRKQRRVEIAEATAKWREKNPDASRRWFEEHPGYHRAWRLANPDKVSAANARRSARREQNGGSHTIEDVQSQYERQDGSCFWCHDVLEDKWHVDHVVPLSKGGSNGKENIVISCPRCNHVKGAKHPMDFAGMMF